MIRRYSHVVMRGQSHPLHPKVLILLFLKFQHSWLRSFHMCQIWERTYLCGHLVEWVAKCDEKSRNPRRRCKNRSIYRRDSDEKHECETCTPLEAREPFAIPGTHQNDNVATNSSASSWPNTVNKKAVAAKRKGLGGWLSRALSKAGKNKMQKAVESLVQCGMTFEMKGIGKP